MYESVCAIYTLSSRWRPCQTRTLASYIVNLWVWVWLPILKFKTLAEIKHSLVCSVFDVEWICTVSTISQSDCSFYIKSQSWLRNSLSMEQLLEKLCSTILILLISFFTWNKCLGLFIFSIVGENQKFEIANSHMHCRLKESSHQTRT